MRKVASGPSGLHEVCQGDGLSTSTGTPVLIEQRVGDAHFAGPGGRLQLRSRGLGVSCGVDVTAVSRFGPRAAGYRPPYRRCGKGGTVMLGELLGRFTVQVAGQRVLPPGEGGNPRVESSAQGSGRLLDSHVRISFTSVVVRRPDGTLFIVESHGLIMTSDGETVSSTGQGIGRFVNAGLASSWRGAVYFQTASAELARLNGVVGVFEQEVDESGKSEIKVFEWK